MSTDLQPPPAREMPVGRRREIRAALVRASHRRRHPRRWLVAAPVAVLALLLGLALAQPWTLGAPDVGVPAVSPTLPAGPSTDAATPSPTPTPTAPVVPAARLTDRGPLSKSDRSRAVSRCLDGLGRATTVATLHFARRTSLSGDAVVFEGRDGISYACSDDGSGLVAGPMSKMGDLPTPDAKHPVVLIDGEGLSSSSGQGRVDARTSGAYRVTDEVASLQSRLVVDGHAGAWFEASRADGWAWTGATVDYAGTMPRRLPGVDFRVDVRAFDADGKRLAVDRTPR